MQVLDRILEAWKRNGHRVLLFSQYVGMLDVLQQYATEKKYTFLRMDGSTSQKARQRLIDEFNHNTGVFLFLLSTKTGGIGVNLTGADRVVIYDPDWNPSTDVQACERAWRTGQTKPVVVYRLICSGTIEEKIYQRQLFKMFLTDRILKDPSKSKRVFCDKELKDLFTLSCTTSGREEQTAARSAHDDIGIVQLGAKKRGKRGGEREGQREGEGQGEGGEQQRGEEREEEAEEGGEASGGSVEGGGEVLEAVRERSVSVEMAIAEEEGGEEEEEEVQEERDESFLQSVLDGVGFAGSISHSAIEAASTRDEEYEKRQQRIRASARVRRMEMEEQSGRSVVGQSAGRRGGGQAGRGQSHAGRQGGATRGGGMFASATSAGAAEVAGGGREGRRRGEREVGEREQAEEGFFGSSRGGEGAAAPVSSSSLLSRLRTLHQTGANK